MNIQNQNTVKKQNYVIWMHKAKLCYMDTDSFIVYINTDDIYRDIAEDFETRFDTSNYDLNRLYKGEKK